MLGFISCDARHMGLWKGFCSNGSGLLPVVAGRKLQLAPTGLVYVCFCLGLSVVFSRFEFGIVSMPQD